MDTVAFHVNVVGSILEHPNVTTASSSSGPAWRYTSRIVGSMEDTLTGSSKVSTKAFASKSMSNFFRSGGVTSGSTFMACRVPATFRFPSSVVPAPQSSTVPDRTPQ